MRSFGVVSPQFWTGETGRRLREMGPVTQVIALYLMTSPHSHMCGLYYIPLQYISYETGQSIKAIRGALATLQNEKFAYYDEWTEFVWIKEMSHWQVGPMRNEDRRAKGIKNWYEGLPPNPFLGLFFDRYGEELLLPSRREGASKVLSRGMQGAATGAGTAPHIPSPDSNLGSSLKGGAGENRKLAFGDSGNVMLTEDEKAGLIAEMGESEFNHYMQSLDDYPGVNPKKFKSYTDHAKVIRTWFRRDVREGKVKSRASPNIHHHTKYCDQQTCPEIREVYYAGLKAYE